MHPANDACIICKAQLFPTEMTFRICSDCLDRLPTKKGN